MSLQVSTAVSFELASDSFIYHLTFCPGHYERKMKHLENQKASKKKMKRIGKVELPQEAFFVSLSTPLA